MGRFKLINVFRFEREPEAVFGIDNLTSVDPVVLGLSELLKLKRSKDVEEAIDRIENYDSEMAEAVINSYPVCRTLPTD
jgi:hypothetical protein